MVPSRWRTQRTEDDSRLENESRETNEKPQDNSDRSYLRTSIADLQILDITAKEAIYFTCWLSSSQPCFAIWSDRHLSMCSACGTWCTRVYMRRVSKWCRQKVWWELSLAKINIRAEFKYGDWWFAWWNLHASIQLYLKKPACSRSFFLFTTFWDEWRQISCNVLKKWL